MSRATTGEDGKARCPWSYAAPDFIEYHDQEWGFPVGDDRELFEKICLESFQSGLSWRTILTKRDNFREAFHNFEMEAVARFNRRDVKRLLNNEGIVRNRAKIEATIANAQATLELAEEAGSLASFVWRYEPEKGSLPEPQSRTTCPEAIALAKDLKKRGFRFVGPTTSFSFFQAMGLLNDHVEGCVTRKKVSAARKKFRRP